MAGPRKFGDPDGTKFNTAAEPVIPPVLAMPVVTVLPPVAAEMLAVSCWQI